MTVPWRSLDFFVAPDWFLRTDSTNDDTRIFFSLWDSVGKFFLGAYVCEECSPSVPVAILIGRSGSGNSSDCVKDAASDNIQEIIFLGSGLMWKDAAVCGGIMEFKILVRDLSEIWKPLESESDMMLLVSLMCWEYRDTLVLTRFHTPYHPPSNRVMDYLIYWVK